MSLLDAYKQKLEAQIQERKAQLTALKARARQVAAQGKILGYEELAQADKHLAQARARYGELKGAGGKALQDIKAGLKMALADLKASTNRAAKHFDKHPAAPKPARRTVKHKKTRTRAKIVKRAKPARTRKSR